MANADLTIDYNVLSSAARLLMECDLKPLQGDRFQPTGFADLGPARYTAPDGTEMLLVESAQSVANRMELACWDEAEQDLIADLRGLPFIRILDTDENRVSNSLLEAHRINSEYIMKKANRVTRENGKIKPAKDDFSKEFADGIAYQKDGRVNWAKFREALLKYDTNSLLHGCFLEEIGGRLRVTRAVSGFIEASGVSIAESGGVKNNIVQPDLKGGEGNVPFHRTEFTGKITAYFNLDLALLRGYGLPDAATHLLIALALFKIRRFLSAGLRLRTACDLEPVNGGLRVTRPSDGFTVVEELALLEECRSLIAICGEAGLFADPPITEVQWKSS